MTQKHFPAIISNHVADGTEAVLGLEMKSILKGDLFYEDKSAKTSDDMPAITVNEQRITINRESLIRAISAWPQTLVLELLITSAPNLQFSAQGKILFTIVLRARAKDGGQARKLAAAKYLSLRALLWAHMSEAEFTPIVDRDELNFRLSPFNPVHAIAIHRRAGTIQISDPIEKKTVAGLACGQTAKAEVKGSYVRYAYPWKASYDDWSRLVSVMMGQLDPLHLLIRLRAGKLTKQKCKVMEEQIKTCELYLGRGKSYQMSLTQQASLLRGALAEGVHALAAGAFNVGVFLLAGHEIDPSLGAMVGQSITAKPAIRDRESFLLGGFDISEVSIGKALDSRYFPEKTLFTIAEAACAFRLPSPPVTEIPGLPVRRSRTAFTLLPDTDQTKKDGIDLCRNIHNGLSQPVHLPADDRMRHAFIIGQTGTGKSTLMESMILQDIRAGHGLAVIDPHGEMVESVIGKIPPERMDDVILFDFLDRGRPLGFNMLQWRTAEERDFVIDEMYETLDKIYDMKETGGPIFETNMRGMLRLLMGDKPDDDYQPTLLEFRDCYLYSGFRRWLKNRNKDRSTIDFVRELERTGGEAQINNIAPYITSKFGRFVHDSTLMNIIGQDRTAFDFEEIMAQGKIFLVNLGKGRFGSSVSALLANQLVSHFKHAAMKRGEMQADQRRDFYLYVDECHNLPASNFTELLSEARKYRMGLVLATQYATQLYSNNPRENLLAAILGNVGCMTLFRLGQEDAKLLAQSLYPYFTMMDIIGLPNWQGYCRLQIKNCTVTPFSFESVMDKTPYDRNVARKVRDLSRHIYGCDVESIRNQIERRQHIWETDKE